jgi:hypothetical protein
MKHLYQFLLPLLLWAPDGAGGGGAPPGDVSLEEWIGRLNGAEKKDRAALVGELAKALGVKVGEAYKKLKEAGWDPKTNNDKNFVNNDTPPAAGERPGHGISALPDDTPHGPSPNGEGPAAGGTPPPASPEGDPPPSGPPRAETSTVTLRHKTPYPHYRRAGLLLTNQWKPYTVTAAQLAALKTDSWVEVREPPKPATP